MLTGPELQQALGAAASAAAPAPAVLHLFDAAPGLDSEFSQRATVSLAVAPSSFANAVPPTPAPTAAATAAAAAAASVAAAAAAASAAAPPQAYAADAQAALLKHGPEPPHLSGFEKRLWAAFCLADRDGSGRISKREFNTILARVRPRRTPHLGANSLYPAPCTLHQAPGTPHAALSVCPTPRPRPRAGGAPPLTLLTLTLTLTLAPTLNQVGLHPSDKDKAAAFKEADRDRSGQIVWEEFCTLGKQLRALGATL